MGFIEIKDLVGLSAPLQKCVDVISAGMGALYRPKAMRNEADAKAYEIIAIAEAEAQASVIASQGQANAQMEYIKTPATGEHEIFERARARLIARELEGQQNVESIAENAIRFLPGTVLDEPVSSDWRRKFFLEAENVCDVDMQELWGKVLAGEVTKPGSFSLRTLGVLKALSREEAEIFRLACSLAYDGGEVIIDQTKKVPLGEYGLHFSALMTLTDAGLLHSASFVHHQFKDLPEELLQINNGLHFHLSGATIKQTVLSVLVFTAAGKELQRLIPPNPCIPYLQDVAKLLRTRHKLTVKKMVETKQDDGSTAITFDEWF